MLRRLHVYNVSISRFLVAMLREQPCGKGKVLFDHLTDIRSRNCVAVLEKFLDGKATVDELKEARRAAVAVYAADAAAYAASAAVYAASAAAASAADAAAVYAASAASAADAAAVYAASAAVYAAAVAAVYAAVYAADAAAAAASSAASREWQVKKIREMVIIEWVD
jgi:hypothetical protein